MRKKVFILGVGAQKSGTTWLHSQLERCGNVDMGCTKEYHVFDVIYSENRPGFRRNLLESIAERIAQNAIGTEQNRYLCKQLSFIDDPENYFDYFDYLHARDSAIEAVGDITPSYSMLDETAFSHIKRGLEDRGFVVKVVFLMRDPVERVWSMCRMHRRDRACAGSEDGTGVAHRASETDELRKLYKSPGSVLRTSYERTIDELEKVFPREHLYYEFFESLFHPRQFNAFGDFLGIDLECPDLDFQANASPKTDLVDPELEEEIACFYAETYRRVRASFGARATRLWRGYRYVPE